MAQYGLYGAIVRHSLSLPEILTRQQQQQQEAQHSQADDETRETTNTNNNASSQMEKKLSANSSLLEADSGINSDQNKSEAERKRSGQLAESPTDTTPAWLLGMHMKSLEISGRINKLNQQKGAAAKQADEASKEKGAEKEEHASGASPDKQKRELSSIFMSVKRIIDCTQPDEPATQPASLTSDAALNQIGTFERDNNMIATNQVIIEKQPNNDQIGGAAQSVSRTRRTRRSFVNNQQQKRRLTKAAAQRLAEIRQQQLKEELGSSNSLQPNRNSPFSFNSSSDLFHHKQSADTNNQLCLRTGLPPPPQSSSLSRGQAQFQLPLNVAQMTDCQASLQTAQQQQQQTQAHQLNPFNQMLTMQTLPHSHNQPSGNMFEPQTLNSLVGPYLAAAAAVVNNRSQQMRCAPQAMNQQSSGWFQHSDNINEPSMHPQLRHNQTNRRAEANQVHFYGSPGLRTNVEASNCIENPFQHLFVSAAMAAAAQASNSNTASHLMHDFNQTQYQTMPSLTHLHTMPTGSNVGTQKQQAELQAQRLLMAAAAAASTIQSQQSTNNCSNLQPQQHSMPAGLWLNEWMQRYMLTQSMNVNQHLPQESRPEPRNHPVLNQSCQMQPSESNVNSSKSITNDNRENRDNKRVKRNTNFKDVANLIASSTDDSYVRNLQEDDSSDQDEDRQIEIQTHIDVVMGVENDIEPKQAQQIRSISATSDEPLSSGESGIQFNQSQQIDHFSGDSFEKNRSGRSSTQTQVNDNEQDEDNNNNNRQPDDLLMCWSSLNMNITRWWFCCPK